ncbi:MAG: DUF512 domain-containing protein [Trueperaceae bacterium]|nr:DUF512 domain-containing protein [Trueperaceae bacterium]
MPRRDPSPPMAPVHAVTPGSPADVAGVEAGWSLLSVNGCEIPDVLAYRRELARGEAELRVRAPGGAETSFQVAWEDPGLAFDDVIFDGIRLCANKCEFCYVHQMPQGFRKSLYVMDDDYRTSFLYGSFVTLTNLSEGDVQRILDEHLSPLYVSVHTADEDLRRDMMKWWRSKVKSEATTRIRHMIERLAPIDLYAQMVLLPGRNDGEHLERTLAYLASRPNVQAVAAVPVGLTAHRTNLPDLKPYDAEEARDVVRRVQAFQERMLRERGTRFVFLSDEFYLRAGVSLPDADAYEGFPMLENGVGMVRDFLARPLPPLPARLPVPRRVLLATGSLFAPALARAVAPLRRIEGLELEVRAIPNRTFGEVTTVAGLLAGRDLLLGVQPGEADLMLVSPNVVKYGTDAFLDERTLPELRRELAMEIEVGGTDLAELARSILTGTGERHLPQFGFSTHAVKENAKQH